MKFTNIFLSFVVCFFYGFFCTQCVSSQQKNQATQITKKIKDGGCILFRLPSADNKINYFEKKGWTGKAAAERAAADQRNKELIAAFKAKFDFCPVYFFEAKENDLVEKGDLAAVHFLDENLQPDATIRPDCRSVMTAVYGDNFKEKEGYKGTTEGIILGAQDFYTFEKPFPRHSPKYFLFFKKTDEKMVEKLNKRLKGFYEKN